MITVLISGAGIAGPALAYWLHRHGFQPTVVEVAPGIRPGGHAVDLRGVARDVVERMGLMPRVREFAVDERGFANVDRTGRVKSRLPADAFGGEGIVAEIEIMRGDLSAILYEATKPFTEYLFGDRITELSQGADGVKATFASGQTRSFDLVIGADGVHSAVRAMAFGSEDEFVRYLGGYTAYFTVPDPGNLDNWFLMFNAPGGLCAGIRPERGGTAKASLSFATPPLAYERRDVAQQRDILRKAFAGVGWMVPQLLDAMEGAPDFYFDSICQVHVGQWWRGRVGLIGDAGYCGSPLSGLGTSTSLVGAYVLAGELASTPDDHERAFARYQSEMKDYVAQCQELPPGGFNGMAPRTQFMIDLRNLSVRMMTRWPVRHFAAKVFAKADAITLKDYR
jgi:2-polyprenyl-6-methoxyphenol hydroxylase-like FAD-dependent oxidoreductase